MTIAVGHAKPSLAVAQINVQSLLIVSAKSVLEPRAPLLMSKELTRVKPIFSVALAGLAPPVPAEPAVVPPIRGLTPATILLAIPVYLTRIVRHLQMVRNTRSVEVVVVLISAEQDRINVRAMSSASTLFAQEADYLLPVWLALLQGQTSVAVIGTVDRQPVLKQKSTEELPTLTPRT